MQQCDGPPGKKKNKLRLIFLSQFFHQSPMKLGMRVLFSFCCTRRRRMDGRLVVVLWPWHSVFLMDNGILYARKQWFIFFYFVHTLSTPNFFLFSSLTRRT